MKAAKTAILLFKWKLITAIFAISQFALIATIFATALLISIATNAKLTYDGERADSKFARIAPTSQFVIGHASSANTTTVQIVLNLIIIIAEAFIIWNHIY